MDVAVSFCCGVFFFKQKTAYEIRISDWSSDVCSSDFASKSSQNSSKVASLRSKRAQALVSGFVELMVRMKSRGRPLRSSKALNASKGLDRITPPKSKKVARMGTRAS